MKLLLLAATTLLNAGTIKPNELNDIYTEAIWFVAVFGVMSVVSIIISKRQAKKYEKENPVKEKTQNTSDLTDEMTPAVVDSTNEIKRVKELSKLAEDGLLTEEEFQILKQHLMK